MSKYVKELEIKYLQKQFDGVNDLLVVNVVGMNATENNQLRLQLRKKGIQLQVVKNSLAQQVFRDKGYAKMDALLDGPTAIAWGGAGIVELAKEISDWAKKLAKLQVKGGCVSGQTVDSAGVARLSELPSREELLGRIVNLALSPGARLAALALGPGGRIAGQLKTMAEASEESASEGPPAEEAAAAPA